MEDKDLPPEVIAAYQFVDKMIQDASDIDSTGAPLWHGWALREAFLAGVKYANKLNADLSVESQEQLEEDLRDFRSEQIKGIYGG